MIDRPYLVAGGGIAGLAAAIGLGRAGKTVRLFEQAPSFEEVGAGLQMSPNGVRALQALGAWDMVEPCCVIPTEIHVRDGRSGAILQRVRLGKPFEERFGAPYRVSHRADLLTALVNVAKDNPAIALHNGTPAVSMESLDGGAHVILEDGRSEHGAAVIAADGIRSTLRGSIHGTVNPVFRGHTIFRALIPLSAVPPGIEADCVTLWLYPGGHLVHYPVSNWRNFNIVAAIDSPEPQTGWSTPGETKELRLVFAEADEHLEDLIDAPTTWLKWQGADLPDLDRWCHGNMVLVGDAAHATLPYLAQGAVMGLEDACVLSTCVSNADLAASAFTRFEQLRRARTGRIQASSRKLARIYHARGPMAAARNAALRFAGTKAVLRQTGWIYEWAP